MRQGLNDLKIPDTAEDIAELTALIADYASVEPDDVEHVREGIFRIDADPQRHFQVLGSFVHELSARQAEDRL